jgi:hypothetical protein
LATDRYEIIKNGANFGHFWHESETMHMGIEACELVVALIRQPVATDRPLALSGRLQRTVRRHKFNKDSPLVTELSDFSSEVWWQGGQRACVTSQGSGCGVFLVSDFGFRVYCRGLPDDHLLPILGRSHSALRTNSGRGRPLLPSDPPSPAGRAIPSG